MAGSPAKLFLRSKTRTALAVEPLESRHLLAGFQVVEVHAPPPVELHSIPALTISLAPDGTDVSGAPNVLHETLDELGTGDWPSSIRRAFETWTQHVDLDVRFVSDGGQAFGSSGLAHHDSRFGDVRVAAIPMVAEVTAMAVARDLKSAGTWAGDILLNSNADFDTVDEVFRAVLHEAGHVLGLSHSDDPDSPMHRHGLAQALTDADIANLQFASDPDRSEEDPDSEGHSNLVDSVAARSEVFSHGDAGDFLAGTLPTGSAVGSPLRLGEVGGGDVLGLPVLVDGSVSNDVATQVHTISVDAPQIVRFSLTASGDDQQLVVATLLDSDGRVLISLTAGSGRGETVLLTAGTYRLDVTLHAGGAGETAYSFQGLGLAQHLGPEVVDPSGSPITPDVDGPGEFCYPDGICSWDTFVWVDEDLEPSPAQADSGSSWYDDWWSWYIDFFSSGSDA